ncbi:unnamed protein product [Lepidochelys olivacea]
MKSAGRYSCGYQHKDEKNQVANSDLSAPLQLKVIGAGVTGQEPCSSPGDFPSPTLSLSTSSAQVGDSVLAQCSLHPNSLAALVIFFQDGKEISSQLTTPGQSYQYKISVWHSGQFRCMYQYRINQNQVNNSRLSLLRTLNVTERSVHSSDADHSNSGSSEKKSITDEKAKRRRPREQLPNHSTENTPMEEQIQYATISEFGTARTSSGAGKRDFNVRRHRESLWQAQLQLLKHMAQPAPAVCIDSEMVGAEEASGTYMG